VNPATDPPVKLSFRLASFRLASRADRLTDIAGEPMGALLDAQRHLRSMTGPRGDGAKRAHPACGQASARARLTLDLTLDLAL
jgi:hypothetical protein